MFQGHEMIGISLVQGRRLMNWVTTFREYLKACSVKFGRNGYAVKSADKNECFLVLIILNLVKSPYGSTNLTEPTSYI